MHYYVNGKTKSWLDDGAFFTNESHRNFVSDAEVRATEPKALTSAGTYVRCGLYHAP